MKEKINSVLEEQITNLKNLKESDYSTKVEKIVDAINSSLDNGGKLLIAGNGGSAADAQHFAAEIVGRFVKERKGYPAIALTTDTSALTAIGNDYGFEQVFSRQVEALGKKNDIFVGISTSGNSKNIVLAMEKANEIGMKTIGLIGKSGGVIKDISDLNIIFNYNETARIQEHHLMTYHLICQFVESHFYDKEHNEN